eukprot:CAMPEP_0181294868 /NCGR_PEP_ID=MMETSP1101-20121128/3836_1 /TAXON_ID=46948 /ORGANISM="Rhodomonas abbreviata, Strain Caron Lab Isolate" /LENGTH=157 /DNA_ID=CAMNT_0023399567 /DNA_START=172 /DNA_END=646 /DNA_ORIENTATION=-
MTSLFSRERDFTCWDTFTLLSLLLSLLSLCGAVASRTVAVLAWRARTPLHLPTALVSSAPLALLLVERTWGRSSVALRARPVASTSKDKRLASTCKHGVAAARRELRLASTCKDERRASTCKHGVASARRERRPGLPAVRSEKTELTQGLIAVLCPP